MRYVAQMLKLYLSANHNNEHITLELKLRQTDNIRLLNNEQNK